MSLRATWAIRLGLDRSGATVPRCHMMLLRAILSSPGYNVSAERPAIIRVAD